MPHIRRVVLALARRLVAASVPDHAPAAIAVLLTDLDPRDRGPRIPSPLPRGQEPQFTDSQELAALGGAHQLQKLVEEILRTFDGRTLDLNEQKAQVENLLADLETASESMRNLRYHGLARPDGAELYGKPTPDQARIWRELAELEELRASARARDDAASRRFSADDRDTWRIRSYQPNGVFRAQRGEEPDLLGWAETPELVAGLLRDWSIPAGRPVTVQWAIPAPTPPRRLPLGGWIPHHPADQPEPEPAADSYVSEAEVDPVQAWEAQPESAITSFGTALATWRQSWSPANDLASRLTEAADRLNTDEPQAETLDTLITGGGVSNETVLGLTVTTAWIDPATIAHSGLIGWNEFGSHRPEQIEFFTKALLDSTDPAKTARNVWGFPFEPVELYLVPGPAGPLYERGCNGTHRIHTARMLGFPLLWAVIRHYSLPTCLSGTDVLDGEPWNSDAHIELLTCWQGLLDRGLIEGQLDTDLCLLRPTWAAAPWLLTHPDHVPMWARNYERVYPGTLAAIGIPHDAWQTPQTWKRWLIASAAEEYQRPTP